MGAVALMSIVAAIVASAPPAHALRQRSEVVELTGGERGTGMPPVAPLENDAVARTASAVTWSDLTSADAWARPAIDYVGSSNDWMRDFRANKDGTYPFRPGTIETRKYLARSVVRAFAPGATPDPGIVFSDLDASSPFYRFANIAVKRGWMSRTSGGAFMPDERVTMTLLHRVLVYALDLRPAAKALNALHTKDGHRFKLPKNFGTTMLGMRLFLRYNNWDEANDVGPSSEMSRAQVAYSLYRAKTQYSWNLDDLRTEYSHIVLPHLGPKQRKIVQWGVRYVGYPYVWGGEWGFDRTEPAALGGQPIPGFDCSGLTWWAIRRDDGASWNITPPRPYRGWDLPQRTSRDMASMTTDRIRYADIRPGDVLFYDGEGNDGVADHVDTYIGKGFALDSSSTPGGVTLMWVGSGWYREHFMFGRRVLG
jgi:cell wall-associated NlpC family hydrolase